MKGIGGLDESSLGRGEGIKAKLLLDENWVGGEKLDSWVWNIWQLTDFNKINFWKEEWGFVPVVLVTLMYVSVYVYVVYFYRNKMSVLSNLNLGGQQKLTRKSFKHLQRKTRAQERRQAWRNGLGHNLRDESHCSRKALVRREKHRKKLRTQDWS